MKRLHSKASVEQGLLHMTADEAAGAGEEYGVPMIGTVCREHPFSMLRRPPSEGYVTAEGAESAKDRGEEETGSDGVAAEEARRGRGQEKDFSSSCTSLLSSTSLLRSLLLGSKVLLRRLRQTSRFITWKGKQRPPARREGC